MRVLFIILYLILPIGMLNVFISCNGQNKSEPDTNLAKNQPTIAIGDTVYELPDSIMAVYQASNNVYWFGSNGRGVYCYHPGEKYLLHYTTKHGLCNNQVWKIEEDKLGSLYFSTGNEISKFDGKTFLTLRCITGLHSEWAMNPDDLWFRSVGGTVLRYDGTTLHMHKLPITQQAEQWIKDHPRSKYPHAGGSPYDIYTVYKDRKGNVWFGTGQAGICGYDGNSFLWVAEDDVTEFHYGPSNGVRSIIEDKDGKFWFSNVLYQYTIYTDSTSKNITQYKREKGIGTLDGDPGHVYLNEYMSALVDTTGTVWIASFGAGVWKYDYTSKKITAYPVIKNNEYVTLYSINRDNNHVLWLGTHVDGAYKFNGKTFEKWTLTK